MPARQKKNPSHFVQIRVKGLVFLSNLRLAPEPLRSSSDKEMHASFYFSLITIFDELLQAFLCDERKIQFKLQLEKKTSCKHKGKRIFKSYRLKNSISYL